ncbi:MAG: hypothetical protein WBW71_14455 [Bacteroidota bacterium]
MEPDNLRIYGTWKFEKSAAAHSGRPSTKPTEYIVHGIIVDQREDLQGETPALDMFKWEYFDKHGEIKYEHDPQIVERTADKVRIESKPSPKNIIGIPLKRWREGNEMHFKGVLLENMPMASDVITLGEALEKYNQAHPENPRYLQFSIEGPPPKRFIRNGKQYYAAEPTNVVVTPQAVGTTTKAQITKTNDRVFKSLQAGYETSPNEMKGGGALRKESLEGSQKNLTITNGSTAMKFSTHKEACEHFKKSGLNDADAKAKADEYFAKRKKDEDEENGEVEKSLNSQTTLLTKSLEALNTIAEEIGEGKDEVKDFQKALRKSVTQLDAGQAIDGGEYLTGQGAAIITLYNIVEKGITGLAKSQSALIESKIADTAVTAALAKRVTEVQEELRKSIQMIEVMTTGLRKSTKGVNDKNLDQLEIDEDGHGDAGATDQEKLMKSLRSIPPKAAEAYLINQAEKVAATDPAQCQKYCEAQELLQKSANILRLEKSLQTELLGVFKPTVSN